MICVLYLPLVCFFIPASIYYSRFSFNFLVDIFLSFIVSSPIDFLVWFVCLKFHLTCIYLVLSDHRFIIILNKPQLVLLKLEHPPYEYSNLHMLFTFLVLNIFSRAYKTFFSLFSCQRS